MSNLKKIIKNKFPKLVDIYRKYYSTPLHKHKIKKKYGSKKNKDIFSEIYEQNLWSNTFSRSGNGSTLEQTEVLRQELNLIFDELNIKSMLDLPCGDFKWMQKTNLGNINYLGGDIVDKIIEENNTKYSRNSIQFKVIDIVNDNLPKVDLIFCRDLLVHLSFSDTFKAIENIKKSGSKYLATTTFPNIKKNEDIVSGDWRTINIEIDPFNLNQPIKRILEQCLSEGYEDKTINLYKIYEL